MEFPFILLLFVFLSVILALAWWGKRRTALFLFCFFLVAACLVFWHHVTSSIDIQL